MDKKSMAIFKRTVGQFFHRAAVSVVAGAAALFFLSGCGSGSDSSGGNDGQNSTFTRAYTPLQASDTHNFFAKLSDDDTDTTTVQESVSGPTESINGINEKVFQVTTNQITANLYGTETVIFYTFQNVTDRGLINYGADTFQAFDQFGSVQRHVQTQTLPSAPYVFTPLKTGTRAEQITESIRYVPTIVLPFGLERGRSTTIQRLDFNQVYSSGSPSTYDPQCYRFTNEGRETVRVPMGTFECIKIKQEIGSVNLNEIYQVRSLWYAENIGLIQYKEDYPNETPSGGLSYQAASAFVSGKQYP